MTTANPVAINCTAAPLFTRADYMNKKCSHQQYYVQFASEEVLEYMTKTDITLDSKLARWDALAAGLYMPRDLLIEAGEISARGLPSISCRLCVAKAAYRQVNGLVDQ